MALLCLRRSCALHLVSFEFGICHFALIFMSPFVKLDVFLIFCRASDTRPKLASYCFFFVSSDNSRTALGRMHTSTKARQYIPCYSVNPYPKSNSQLCKIVTVTQNCYCDGVTMPPPNHNPYPTPILT